LDRTHAPQVGAPAAVAVAYVRHHPTQTALHTLVAKHLET